LTKKYSWRTYIWITSYLQFLHGVLKLFIRGRFREDAYCLFESHRHLKAQARHYRCRCSVRLPSWHQKRISCNYWFHQVLSSPLIFFPDQNQFPFLRLLRFHLDFDYYQRILNASLTCLCILLSFDLFKLRISFVFFEILFFLSNFDSCKSF
jgi:hypothetical protein